MGVCANRGANRAHCGWYHRVNPFVPWGLGLGGVIREGEGVFGGLVGRDRGVEDEVLFVVYCVYWACIRRVLCVACTVLCIV